MTALAVALAIVAGAAIASAITIARTAAMRERVQRERAERAEARVRDVEGMLDQVRADRHHIAPPASVSAGQTVSLPQELLDELEHIEDPDAKAEFRQNAEMLLALDPAMRTELLIKQTFGLEEAGT